MTRRAMYGVAVVLACLLDGVFTAFAAAPPNVVIMFTDDQGYGDPGCFGHPTIATPNIDRLAAEGARLTHFHVASPVYSPSRAALRAFVGIWVPVAGSPSFRSFE